MKAFKKRAVSALAALTAFGLLAGCTGNSEGTTAAGGSTTSSSKTPITLKVEVFDRGNSPSGVTVSNNPMTQWIQQSFGDPNNMKLEFTPVPRTQEVEKLNVMMASGDAPDIVFTYDANVVFNYVQQGGLADLGKLIDQHGPNLKSYLGEATLKYGQFDGVQYAIPARRVYLGKYSSMIRKDWLDKLGLPVPQTTDEVYKTLKAFKEKKPGGDQTIPLGFFLGAASYEPLVWSFIKNTSEEEKYGSMMMLGSREYPVLMPGHKDAFRFLNKLYNEGLVSPDFALDKDKKKMWQDIMTGKVGMYAEDAGDSYKTTPGVYPILEKNVQGAKLQPIDPYTNEEGKHAKPGYQPAGMFIMVPKFSKNAEAAVKYLNWMAQKDVLTRLVYGEEGKNHKLVDGLPVLMDNDETKNLLYNPGDNAIISNDIDFGSEDKNLKAKSLVLPENYRADAMVSYKNGLTDGAAPLRFPRPIQAEVKNGKALLDKYEQMLVKSMMAKPDSFDKTYDDALKDFMSSGGDAIQKERQEAYKSMKK
ncbi:extracellular solute-binding protein [Paenibacillus sp. y28]|uniref:extracellular solute-binding protein n=1 Tax=Paenibacillus sp. y28 TaxID=3129110 RepID=UPI00301631A7